MMNRARGTRLAFDPRYRTLGKLQPTCSAQDVDGDGRRGLSTKVPQAAGDEAMNKEEDGSVGR